MSHKTDATLRPFLFAFPHCVPSGRFSRRFAPLNDIKCVARNSIKSVRKFYYFLTNKLLFIPYEVLCHCEAPPIMGTPKDTLYFWGKGVCKHNTGDCRLRRLTGQKRSIRRVAISRKGILVIKLRNRLIILFLLFINIFIII